MVRHILGFSHLTPAERIELAEQLWDSLSPEAFPPTEAQATELRRRRAELKADSALGEPWSQALDDLEQRGE